MLGQRRLELRLREPRTLFGRREQGVGDSAATQRTGNDAELQAGDEEARCLARDRGGIAQRATSAEDESDLKRQPDHVGALQRPGNEKHPEHRRKG